MEELVMTRERLMLYINNRLEMMTDRQLMRVLNFIKGFNYQ